MPGNSGDVRLSVSRVEVNSTDCASAHGLAQSFGRPIFEPTWWPEDTSPVTYFLDESPSGATFRIGSIRRDGTPIVVIGRAGEQEERTLPPGDWSRPPELGAWRGLVRTNDSQMHAVLYRDQQTIHLIGYANEAEVVRAVNSLRRVVVH